MTILFLIATALLAFLQTTDSVLSPRAIAIVTAAVGLGISLLALYKLNIYRARGVIGAVVQAYGIIAPFNSTFPKTVGMVIAVIGVAGGLILMLTAERVQGGASKASVRTAAAHAQSARG